MSTYIQSAIDNKKYCKSNGQFTRHLRANDITYQEYFEKHVSKKKELCGCGKSKTFYQKTETYAGSCGDAKCVGNTVSRTKKNWTEEQKESDRKNKRKASAARTPEQVAQQIEKTKKTFRKKYGTDWVTQSDEYKQKSQQTKLERYGDKNYANWEKSAEANRNKTVEEQNEINKKRRVTNKERFGVENSFMRPEVIAKAMKSNAKGKEYTLPSGSVVGVRGYESFALDILFEQGYKEDELLIDNRLRTGNGIPSFEYVNVNEHRSKYYPDIYIPKENKIIEVKSQWWWDAYGDEKYAGRIVNNKRKKAAVLGAGYSYEVWLFSDKYEYEIL